MTIIKYLKGIININGKLHNKEHYQNKVTMSKANKISL